MSPVEISSLLYFLHLNINCGYNTLKLKLQKAISRYYSVIVNTVFTFLEKKPTYKLYVVGSFSDGSNYESSDIDMMICFTDRECYDDYYIPNEELKRVYIAVRKNASAGYTLVAKADMLQEFLPFKGAKTSKGPLSELSVDDDSLELFRCLLTSFPKSTKCGPAVNFNKETCTTVCPFLTKLHKPGTTNALKKILSSFGDIPDDAEVEKVIEEAFSGGIDIVTAIPFKNKSLEDSWVHRKRRHSWPSPEMIQDISLLHGHVVPVGMIGSPLEQIEWRISYTLMENKLICSLNEEQMLLYIELKKYAKRSGCLTSYMIKNIVLWMAECLPLHYFQKKYFIPLVRSTLVVLRTCVERKSLPNYMIPSRNLFAGKLDDETKRQKLLDFLSSSSGKDYTIPISCPKFQSLFQDLYSGDIEKNTKLRMENLMALVQHLINMFNTSQVTILSQLPLIIYVDRLLTRS